MPGPRYYRKTDRFFLFWQTLMLRFRKPLLLLLAIPALSLPVSAQTGGEAGIQGTVTDASGAAIPGATVTVTNDATGVTISRQTTGDGLYTVSPILPGVYTVRVKAQGFSDYVQRNLTANALVLTPLNVSMQVGSAETAVEVTAAPPQLETNNASIGLTVENTTYANLPLALNGQQRDPTYVAALSPGATTGTRLPIIGGTGNYLGQLYLDGLPAQTVSQQGDNRLVSQSITVDAVDQMQIITSTPPVEYAGAGASNFTMKSGSLAYHGSVKDFIRNTSLDAYPFSGKTRDASGKILPKPVDHQNELSITFGGHVPGTKRVFFFFAYDKYHNRTQTNPTTFTVPTALMKNGDFTELNGGVGSGGLTGNTNNQAFLYDPTTTTCAGSTCTRQPFQGLKNGVPTNNVIPASYISPIAKAMEQFLPDPTNPGSLANNYSASLVRGFDNHLYNYRVDFQWNEKHRISTVGALGTVNYLNNYGLPYLPQPYTGGDLASIYPKVFDVQDAYTISNTMVNQLKFGYVRFFQNIQSSTQNDPRYQIGKMGITNLPAGQAGQNFPAATFAATTKFGTPIQTWQAAQGTTPSSATATQLTTPNNFALVDNLQWVKGAHTLSFGITVQWQQINNANPATFTGLLLLPYTANSTANFGAGSNALNSAATGYSYASFILGAVGGQPSLGLQYVSEVGGRYRPIAPYVSDTWKVNSKFTIDAGLRWDYLPPYREVKNRWSFLNPNLTNPSTGTPGAIQFAGNQGGGAASCNCTTPVQTYWKNWGPRVGITFAPDDKTVFRAGIGRVYSQGGGVGGRGGAFNGTGQLDFNTTATAPAEVTTGAGTGPSFYLNNSAFFQSIGRANTSLFGPGFAYPAPATPGTATQILNAGHYIGANGRPVTASTVSYADPYFSSRAPNFMFYNVGMQRALTNNLTLGINYVGNQSHHLINSTNSGTGSARGQWTNQLNPIYLAGLGNQVAATGNLPLLTAPATPANVAKAQSVMQSVNIPAFFQAAAAAGDTTATIAQGLTAFPQYNGVTDTWGNVGNFSYNSLQVTMEQRLSHGLTFQFNYTWSRNVGDDGSFRSGFPIPAAAISGGTQAYRQDRIDRSQTTVNSPHIINWFGVWNLPFGKDHLGGANMWTRALASGWQISGIYTYASGAPAVITYGGCTAPLLGQCMPDINPNFAGSARINGGFGKSPNGGRLAANLGQCDVGKTCPAVSYFSTNAFKSPTNISPAGVNPINLIGNAPRTGAWGLINPASWNIDTSVKRSFALPREGMALVVEADAFNTLNHVTFANPNAVWGASNFGTISSARSSYNPRGFEFAGHFTF